MLEKENIKYSLKNLVARKSRSFLTILSILIGITTIFIFISFGFGLYSYVDTLSSKAGADKFFVQVKGVGAPGTDQNFKLTKDDLHTVEKTSGVKTIAPFYLKPVKVEQDHERKYVYLLGLTGKEADSRLIREMNGIDMLSGREIKTGDSGKVVLGYNYQLPNKIFKKPLTLGDKLLLNDRKFDIIGFYESVGNPQDDSQVYISEKDMKELFGEDISYAMFIGSVVDRSQLASVTGLVEKNLRKERNQEEGKEDFFVQTFEEAIAQFSTSLNIIIGFVIMIALISVIVSAVNTTNTMITSVLERINEIGVMKAIGARNSTIRNIFLFESSTLGFVAGVLGVTFGAIFATLAGQILTGLGWGFLAPKYTWQMFALLILFATLVGTVSGVSVAIRASKQSPVEALRYE